MNYDNPAARLLALLLVGKSKPSNAQCRGVWEEILEAQGNQPLLMARLGKVMELPALIIEAVQQAFPEEGNTWSHWASQVNAGFMVQNLHAGWDTFINNIDDHSITYLRMTSNLLASKSNTKLIAAESLSAIRGELQRIHDELMESDQPDEVKKYLSRNIRGMIVSIDEYRLTGALPLLDAIDTTVGHALLEKSYKSFLTDTELGRRLLDTLSSMANVVTVAVGIPQLTATYALLAQ
jgi:hypothetical protein